MRYLCGLDELVDEVHGVLTAVGLTHHHGNTLWTDAIIWRHAQRQRSLSEAVEANEF